MSNPANEMDEIVAEFLVESVESLDRLDRDLLALERDPRSPEVLAGIFRTMHTIKGTCGFLGFTRLERVAHAAESLLAALRDGTLTLTPTVAGSLLATGDALRAMLAEIEASGADGDDDHDELVDELERLRAPGGDAAERGGPRAARAGPRAGAHGLDGARRRRAPGRADDHGRAAGAGPEPAAGAGGRGLGAGPARRGAADEPDHRRAPAQRDGDPDAADLDRVGEVPARRARPGADAGQAGADRDRRRRDRAGPLDRRGREGSADPPGAERRRPRHRAARGAARGRQARGGRADGARLARGRAGRHRGDRRRRRDPRRRAAGARGGDAVRHAAGSPSHERARRARADLPAGVHDLGAGHERLRPRDRHGRRPREHRARRRQRGDLDRARPRHDLQDPDPADARDRLGVPGERRRRALRDPPGEPAGAGARRARRDRAAARRAGDPAPRRAAGAGGPGTRAGRGRGLGARRRPGGRAPGGGPALRPGGRERRRSVRGRREAARRRS